MGSKGLALNGLGKHTEAIQYFDKVLAIDPNEVNSLHFIGAGSR